MDSDLYHRTLFGYRESYGVAIGKKLRYRHSRSYPYGLDRSTFAAKLMRRFTKGLNYSLTGRQRFSGWNSGPWEEFER